MPRCHTLTGRRELKRKHNRNLMREKTIRILKDKEKQFFYWDDVHFQVCALNFHKVSEKFGKVSMAQAGFFCNCGHTFEKKNPLNLNSLFQFSFSLEECSSF